MEPSQLAAEPPRSGHWILRQWLRRFSIGLMVVVGACLGGLTLLGFAGRIHWALDLASHFRMQYFVCLAVLTVLLLCLRSGRWAAALGVFAAVNLGMVAPFYLARVPSATDGTVRLRAMLANVHTQNSRRDLVLDSIRRHDPEFVLLQEVDERWMNDLEVLRQSHPHVLAEPRGDNFGITLFSKHPFASSEVVNLAGAQVPSLLAKFNMNGKNLILLGTHPVPPVGWQGWTWRNEQLEAIPAFLRKQTNGTDPVLLLGDLNASPWCPAFRRLVKESGLCDSERGFGFQPTWPTPLYVPRARSLLMRIPIDHCLASPELRVTHREIGEDIGSDHFPLIVDFVMAR